MKVLVVDDSTAMRMIIIRSLKQAGLSDLTTCEASNGREALKTIDGQKPELVLSGWNMPEMKGIDLLRNLRSAGNNVHFGFITSESNWAVHDEALKAGAAFVIRKPFTPHGLAAALSPILNKGTSWKSFVSTPLSCKLLDIQEILYNLYGGETLVKETPTPVGATDLASLAIYANDAGIVQRAILCDFTLANAAGAALSRMPPGMVVQAVEMRLIDENVMNNLREVMNIWVNLVSDDVNERLILNQFHTVAPKQPLPAVPAFTSTTTFEVEFPRYPRGRMMLCSIG